MLPVVAGVATTRRHHDNEPASSQTVELIVATAPVAAIVLLALNLRTAVTALSGALIGKDAFQEIDINGITLPMTKHNYLVRDANDLPRVIAEAFHIASTGRPGPVLVDISKDALQSTTTFAWPTELNLPGYRPVTRPHAKQVREAAKLILEARRPVLYVGGGVIRARATYSPGESTGPRQWSPQRSVASARWTSSETLRSSSGGRDHRARRSADGDGDRQGLSP